ncbi:SagB/ThcOx family dehydrogenase [Desulfosporosinus fructosivorans]|uniref:SagB/ThcOx family dehydrogenase n=1 Tax=Desulfosporosinus fructosivorans TaxID=2018669 RepID=A0A4Z0QZY7_9FIRM|nr:SagB/ThcOx family dehydrogenase [Desulfosporosinus fructosivorans]TGE34936.1 SagB/ThcOx family dehydrogenase [Desulfosporosinus fructosivorans]
MDETGQQFLNRTKHCNLGPSDQYLGKPQPPIQLEYDKAQPIIKLPKPSKIVTEFVDSRKIVEQRISLRKYSIEPLTMDQLSYLLWCTQGVKKVFQGTATLRNVPSAGARHALETYLLINNVEGIKPGLYRFLALEHGLIGVSLDQDIADKITKACLNQNFVKSSAVTFLWVAVPYRMNWRYGERGYRYLYLDAGHVCQNLYISAESVNCGTCAIAAYSDDELNQLLGLDGKEQFVIYLATVGSK